MKKEMKKIVDANLKVLNIYMKEILKTARANPKDPEAMERNLRILNIIGSDMERLQRLEAEKPMEGFVD